MILATLPTVLCQNRTPRSVTDLIVVHTNEGPEGANSAEGLAAYLTHTTNGAGYNVVVDENSAVRCAADREAVWGAGGVNHRAWHICLIGYSAQTAAQWDDPASRATIVAAADLVRQACDLLGVPKARTTDSRPGSRGICGHADVSRYYTASMGHSDPGPSFPWDHFIALVNGGASAPEGEFTMDQEARDAFAKLESQVETLLAFNTEVKGIPIDTTDPKLAHVGMASRVKNVDAGIGELKKGLGQSLVWLGQKLAARLGS